MSDLFAPLREPQPVAALAPEEVRRRGDRMRRRRAGLVVGSTVAAVAVVLGGTSMMVGDGTSTDSAPGPVDTPDAQSLFPPELDLADGMLREAAESDDEAPRLSACGERIALAQTPTATDEVANVGQGDFEVRSLHLFSDVGTAKSVGDDLVAEFESCPQFTNDRGRVWTTTVRTTSYGDQSWAVEQFGEAPGRYVHLPEVIQVVRLGEHLLVLRQREIHGVPIDVQTTWAGLKVEWLMHRQLCLLTDEGCGWRSDPDILRPDGWGDVQLGMSRADLEEIGFTEFRSHGECTAVDLGSGEGFLSASDELVVIRVPADVTTPEGLGAGSSVDEAHQQHLLENPNSDVLVARASPTADYVMPVEAGQINELTLSTVDEECTG